jgi:hypothetical protein
MNHTPTNAEQEAAACPFCGSAAHVEDHRLSWSVHCDGCTACVLGERSPEPDGEMPDEYWRGIRQTAITAWNRRAAMQAAEPVRRYPGTEIAAFANIAGFKVVIDDTLPAGTMEMRGANTVRCVNIGEPGTDSAAISRAGRVLADRSADACGVDREDNWKVYGHDFIEDARAAIAALQQEGE